MVEGVKSMEGLRQRHGKTNQEAQPGIEAGKTAAGGERLIISAPPPTATEVVQNIALAQGLRVSTPKRTAVEKEGLSVSPSLPMSDQEHQEAVDNIALAQGMLVATPKISEKDENEDTMNESLLGDHHSRSNGHSDDAAKRKSRGISPSDRHALARLWKETTSHDAKYLGIGVGAMFVSSATNMAFPSLVGRVLDRTTKAGADVINSGVGEKVGNASLGTFVLRALAIFLAGAIGSCVRTHCLRMAKEGTATRLRKKLIRTLLRQEKAFFDDPAQGGNRTGEMVAVLEGEIEAASEVFTTKLADGLRSASSAFNGTAMLLRLSPKLTGVSLGLVPIFSVAIAANVMLTRRLTTRQRELAAAATGFAQERLANLTTVRAFTAEENDEKAYTALLYEAHELARQVSLAKGVFMGGLFFAGSATLTAVLYFGGSLAGAGEMTVGDLTSFVMYTGLVGLGYSGLSNYISDTWKSAVSARRVFDLLDREPIAVGKVSGERPAGPAKGHVRFEDVTFEYPNRKEVDVLKGVDLEIKPGQVAAIVGPSGAGKSTLLALLLRLYEPSSGRVLIDEMDAAHLDASWIRNQIGIVDQEPALFTGTIAGNIRYGRADATEAEVIKAAKDANAHEFISSFPEGYQTYVGERGKAQISGGQRQRIALARALLKQPPILLLDEATSALDHESERLVQEALEKAMKGRTVIVIAHRLSTIKKADVIMVVEKGKIVETGIFQDLINLQNGTFARLHSSITPA